MGNVIIRFYTYLNTYYNLRSKYSQYIISLGTLLTIKFKNENITRSL